MSDHENVDNPLEGDQLDNSTLAVSTSEVASTTGSVRTAKTPHRVSSSSDRQIKVERAQKALENAALVSKRIKEHRKATAELLGRPFEDDDAGDTASEMASAISERTGYSVATDTSTTLSVKEALNIPGISESLANTLKQKELLMERIKQYKEISKRPSLAKSSPISKKDHVAEVKKTTESTDLTQLINSVKEKDNALSLMQVKVKAMENTILDLQEKIHEKNQIIEAKNMATTLMSDNLSKKEKDSMLLLEDTRQQMIKMQENFVTIETEWKEEKQGMLKELELKDEKIKNLEEANTILENARFEISVAHSKLLEELDIKNNQIKTLQEKIENIKQLQPETLPEVEDINKEEKGSIEISNMVELTKKIELLEQLNCEIRQTNKELENRLTTVTEPKPTSSPVKKGSPLPSRKGKNVASKMKSPWSNLSPESSPNDPEKKPNKNEIAKLEMLVKSLNKDILDKEYAIAQKNELISELQSSNSEKEATISELRNELKPTFDTVDIGISTELTESLQPIEKKETHITQAVEGDHRISLNELKEALKAAQHQIEILNADIDTSNKNMIKVKSAHKLKIKQMQKTIDNFSKVSDANSEIVKLNEELQQLTQKVAELEEEKGNLQLHLVDYDSGRLTETEIYKKMIEMENLAETRLKAISVLETQKFDLVQELHMLQQKYVDMEDKLADLSQFQNEQVCSEIKSVQLEEQIDNLMASQKELELVIENLKLDKEQLNGAIKILQEEKDDILHRLENYIQENMELTDKLEKLSAEKVSSAESIEIVESLTTQEKLELEEYNKGKISETHGDDFQEPVHPDNETTIEKLIQQNSELTKKIELFTQERQEVMEKMGKISSENEELFNQIQTLKNLSADLQTNIDLLNREKFEVQNLNDSLSQQIEELKRERIEIITESVELPKPSVIDDTIETTSDLQHDEKSTIDKGSRTKSVKQLTKEILKLKNIIKEREAEIADCHMKILSLEEHQQKQNELMESNTSIETRMKVLIEENEQLKDKIVTMEKNSNTEKELLQAKNAYDALQEELHIMRQEFTSTLNSRDSKINELDNLLKEYEMQVFNYGNTLQQKDKELSEYINQITKLNDVSQKLKSTIELLEEEKSKDPNGELVKSLNKQITVYQKKLSDYEEKIRILEDENAQLLSLKSSLEGKNNSLESELQKIQESFGENQVLIKELQTQQQKHAEEVANVKQQTVERDVEIHDIKLQLRKESIENEKLRTTLSHKEKHIEDLITENEEKIKKILDDRNRLNDQYEAIELKNKELMEKLKKFALNIKKKSSMYSELESQLIETQKQLESKNAQIEQFLIQIETLPTLQDKVKHAEEEINRLQAQKQTMELQKSENVTQLQDEMISLERNLAMASEEILKLNESLNKLQNELLLSCEEKTQLKAQVDALQNKLVEYEIEQKNNINLITKISSLEADINQKQQHTSDLSLQLEQQIQQLNQLQFGHDAKIQERDLFIENLETEIGKYKNRICRLEESISIMEDRRHSLERKADQLDDQLREKQKAYNEYSNQEDVLVARLAVLMDHDRVIEKQLYEIESDNKELQYKIQNTNEENQRLRKALSDIQEHCNNLQDKASRTDIADAELLKYQSHIHDLENNLKRLTHEHQTLLVQRKQDIEDLEIEFNTQIENAIKEKKALSEKYEKINEHVTQLELKLQEYRRNTENLNINLEELSKINEELVQKSANKEQAPDYTDQYINEINNLNSLLNQKTQESNELQNMIQVIQNKNVATISELESRISDLQANLQNTHSQVEELNIELNNIKQENGQLQNDLAYKEDIIKDLKEKKKVTFEMNIPKTEGMIISSTIEALSEEGPKYDMSAIESQIITDIDSGAQNKNVATKISDYFQSQPVVEGDIARQSIEPEIIPKKTYLCYTGDKDVVDEVDPFNSDEGWGLGGTEETGDIIPGMSHLNQKILELQKENEALKNDLDTSNAKVLKALKRLKELKAHNDMLSKEIKLSKQISQSSCLDSAIEDELQNKIQDLEKRIEELTADLVKERRDKETVKKQNEVFSNANDKLTDMKEKMDNEVELWKFKFKEINDKLSSLQWDTKDSPVHKAHEELAATGDNAMTDEIVKLEKENEELQQALDQLTAQNKELSIKQTKMKNEIDDLNKKIQQNAVETTSLSNTVSELQRSNSDLTKNNELFKQNLHDLEINYKDLLQKYDHFKEETLLTFEREYKDLPEKCLQLEETVKLLETSEREAMKKVQDLTLQIDTLKLQFNEEQQSAAKLHSGDTLISSEKCTALEDQCLQFRNQLEMANNTIKELETLKAELLKKIESYDEMFVKYTQQIRNYEVNIEELTNKLNLEAVRAVNDNQQTTGQEEQVYELNAKLQQLNNENDQLLSTVAELRSSIASAVDQRGFEISELWKQHLAQREADFQKMEQELRGELTASESKYEQLLDSVQSSSQEETNKLVMMEQVNSLQNKLQDKEEHLRNLQDKYAEIMNQIELLRSETEDEKIMHDNKLLAQQDEYEKIIRELRIKQAENVELSEENLTKIRTELTEAQNENILLTEKVEELESKINESEKRILELANEIQIKDSEIYQKSLEYGHTLSQRNEEFENVRKHLIDYEKQIEEISYEKESELAILRLKMHENNEHHEKIELELGDEKLSLSEALNEKIVECTNLNKQITQLNQTLEEHSSRVAEMQIALENQEVDIVTLKDEITHLQSLIKASSSKIEKHVTFATGTKPGAEGENPESELNAELLDAVPRAELDLALYMLHQRDVRCEELTMELTQLLEERDTLQLRLSDSLRSNEDFKSKCKAAGLDESFNSSQETVSELPSFSMDREQQFVDTHRASLSSTTSDPDSDRPKLQAKLTELRSVKHSRDVRLRHESEQRQMDLRLLHRDVANLPPEAIDQLAQAHHTLSRDSQSTSTVLLNWLRGKSTPKVVHM